MQDIQEQDSTDKNSVCCASLEDRVRENPTCAILTAVGVGVALALVVRALRQPEQPRSQVKQLLEDIQERLHDLTDPALSRLNEFAGESSAALKKSARHVDGIHKNLQSLGCRLRNVFSIGSPSQVFLQPADKIHPPVVSFPLAISVVYL